MKIRCNSFCLLLLYSSSFPFFNGDINFPLFLCPLVNLFVQQTQWCQRMKMDLKTSLQGLFLTSIVPSGNEINRPGILRRDRGLFHSLLNECTHLLYFSLGIKRPIRSETLFQHLQLCSPWLAHRGKKYCLHLEINLKDVFASCALHGI